MASGPEDATLAIPECVNVARSRTSSLIFGSLGRETGIEERVKGVMFVGGMISDCFRTSVAAAGSTVLLALTAFAFCGGGSSGWRARQRAI